MRFPSLVRMAVAAVVTSFFLFVPTAAHAVAGSPPVITDYTQVGTSIELGGSNFTGTTAVQFDGVNAVSFHVASDTSLTATAPALPVGYHAITVTNGAGTSNAGFPYVVSPQAPTITSLSQSSGSTNGGDHIVVRGSGFSTLRYVFMDGRPVANYDLVNDSQIDVTTAAHAAGTVQLSITTAGGTAQHAFTYQAAYTPAAKPWITYAYSGGGWAVINGYGLSNTTGVTVGGHAATVTSSTNNRVVVKLPAHTWGWQYISTKNAVNTSNTIATYIR